MEKITTKMGNFNIQTTSSRSINHYYCDIFHRLLCIHSPLFPINVWTPQAWLTFYTESNACLLLLVGLASVGVSSRTEGIREAKSEFACVCSLPERSQVWLCPSPSGHKRFQVAPSHNYCPEFCDSSLPLSLPSRHRLRNSSQEFLAPKCLPSSFLCLRLKKIFIS